MKKTISRIGCFLLAILLGLYSVAIPADADALSPGEWFVTGYYRVTSDGVMGYNGRYVMDGGAQEIESSLYAGQLFMQELPIPLWELLGIVVLVKMNMGMDSIMFGMAGWMLLT